MGAQHHGIPLPIRIRWSWPSLDGSTRLNSEIQAEDHAIAARKDLCAALAQAEQNEAAAAQALAQAQQIAAQKVAEALSQSAAVEANTSSTLARVHQQIGAT